MAHYGYLVFRMAHPLSIFDNGLDDYLGNIIFLEAHKQNSANLSEAGSSGTLVRFGALTSAFLLQYIVPLILIFLGFGLIAKEREDATLKILSIQGASNRAIIWGKILGFWQFSLLFLFPVFVLIALVMLWDRSVAFEEVAVRICVLLLSYMLYYFVICTMTVVVSAISKKASSALVTLIGSWLFMVIFLPKGIQFAAQNLYPASSRIALEQREGYHNKWDEAKLPTMEKFYKAYPQFKQFKINESDSFSWTWYYAMQHMGDLEVAAPSEQYIAKMRKRNRAAVVLGYFFPNIHTQLTENDLAQSGMENHLAFGSALKKFHEKKRLFFYPLIFSGKDADSVNWKLQIPEVFRQPTKINSIALFLPYIFIIILFILLSQNNIRKL